MSHASASTLDHQWDSYGILNVQRDSRCVGWAPSMGRKCRNVVNWRDMETFYSLLTELSSQPMDPIVLQTRLRELASLGLCRQVHRRAQIDRMVDTWTRKIRDVHWTQLQVEPLYSRPDTRSSTTSFASTDPIHTPATRSTRASDPTVSARLSHTAQAENDIYSTLLCLEALHEQQRILMLRLASLQTPNAPRLDTIRAPARVNTESVSSRRLSDTSSDAPSRTLRSQTSSTSHRSAAPRTPSQSTLRSSSSDSSSPDHRRPPYDSSDPQTSRSRRFVVPSPSPTAYAPTAMNASTATDTGPRTALQEGPDALRQDFLMAQIFHDALSTTSLSSFPHSTDNRNDTASPPPSAASMPTTSPPPSCTRTHVRRLPLSGDCPICYSAMLPAEGLVWCKSVCGQSVHASCMEAWRASLVTGGREVRCTMCRSVWEECGC